MKVALACWNQRIAPVFDVARELRIIEVEAGRLVGDSMEALPKESGWQKVKQLDELKIDTLICGAISRPMHEFISAHGIMVLAFIAGNLDQVIKAWLNGTFDVNRFAMPGCGRNCRRRRRGPGRFNQK